MKTINTLIGLGIQPNTDFDYHGQFVQDFPKYSTGNPSKPTNNTKVYSSSSAFQGDNGTSHYYEIIAVDRANGVNRRACLNNDDTCVSKITKRNIIKSRTRTLECCEVYDCTNTRDCQKRSGLSECTCLHARVANDCDYETTKLINALSGIWEVFWLCSSQKA